MKKAVVVQCRLGSTRLKNKALKLIDNKTILEYVLNSMKKVDASIYYVVTDFYSLEKLKPIVEKCGWNIFAGSEFDVLDRFCSFLRFYFVVQFLYWHKLNRKIYKIKPMFLNLLM